MTQNQSLSTEDVAKILHVSKSTIYNLIDQGEIHSYKIGRKIRFTQDDVDAYIARSRHEHSTRPVHVIDTHSTLLPQDHPVIPDMIISGQDVILDILATELNQNDISTARTYLGGFEGLLSLYQGKVHAVACHLFDGTDFNISYIRAMLPGVPVKVYNLSYRRIGFYVAKGNPKDIRNWADLTRGDLTLLNRRPGSGSRIILDIQLKKLGMSSQAIKGYDKIMQSHLTMAAGIASGEADYAIGTERITKQMDGLDFVPLMEERMDLAVRPDLLTPKQLETLESLLRSTYFKNEVAPFSGNDYRHLGKLIAEV